MSFGRVDLEIMQMEGQSRRHRMNRENDFIREHLGEEPDRLERSSRRASQLKKARKAAEKKGKRFSSF